jgi:hypothetical protein
MRLADILTEYVLPDLFDELPPASESIETADQQSPADLDQSPVVVMVAILLCLLGAITISIRLMAEISSVSRWLLFGQPRLYWRIAAIGELFWPQF